MSTELELTKAALDAASRHIYGGSDEDFMEFTAKVRTLEDFKKQQQPADTVMISRELGEVIASRLVVCSDMHSQNLYKSLKTALSK